MQASFKELSPAKLNLFLKIVGKREDGFHNIRSGVTLINLFDEVIAKKNSRFTLKYIGRFAPENNKFEDCIIEKIFSKLKIEKPNYAFTIKKNTPIMSGLGSASSNAATVIKILEKLNYKDLKKKGSGNSTEQLSKITVLKQLRNEQEMYNKAKNLGQMAQNTQKNFNKYINKEQDWLNKDSLNTLYLERHKNKIRFSNSFTKK